MLREAESCLGAREGRGWQPLSLLREGRGLQGGSRPQGGAWSSRRLSHPLPGELHRKPRLLVWILLAPFFFQVSHAVPSWEAWWWEVARRYQGLPYLWGGEGRGGFDCSGLVVWLYRHLGFHLPRTSREQHRSLPPASGSLRPGDLLFFASRGPSVDHVAIYLGRGYVLHASARWGRVVVEAWTAVPGRYLGARRPWLLPRFPLGAGETP